MSILVSQLEAPLSCSLFREYYLLLLFYLLFSKRRQHLRCNLLFGLICHFDLLKDINISFFLYPPPFVFYRKYQFKFFHTVCISLLCLHFHLYHVPNFCRVSCMHNTFMFRLLSCSGPVTSHKTT